MSYAKFFDDIDMVLRSKAHPVSRYICLLGSALVLLSCATNPATKPVSTSSEPIQFSKPLAVDFENVPAAAILQTLSSYSQMYLVFDDNMTPTDNITLRAQNSTFGNVFKMVLKSQCLSYHKANQHSLIITNSPDDTCQRIPADTPIILKK